MNLQIAAESRAQHAGFQRAHVHLQSLRVCVNE